jgi:DNA-binding transcriptional ArsR family regulator
MYDDRMIKTLNEKKRRTMLELLREKYPDGLSFSEVVDLTDLKPTSVAYHIGKLMEGGLIEKIPGTRPGKRDYSFYRISERGLEGLQIVRELGETNSGRKPSVIVIPAEIEILTFDSMPSGFVVEKL